MTRREGQVIVRGSVAYASQNPWYAFLINLELFNQKHPPRIMSATVRENIIFSHEYEETFYNMVIDGADLYTFIINLDSR